MPSVIIHPPARKNPPSTVENPLPQLLHTPSGLALLEIQGTFHFPTSAQSSTHVGKLVFPLHNPTINDPTDMKWMKRVYMYVGQGQRMTGECKKLAKPIAVVRKVHIEEDDDGNAGMSDTGEEDKDQSARQEELEIVEIVKYKIVFSARPEPISGVTEEE